MLIEFGSVSPRKGGTKLKPAGDLLALYMERLRRYTPAETTVFASEAALLAHAERSSRMPAARVWLLDSRGRGLSSAEWAGSLSELRDRGTQRVLLGIGPADGWTAAARARADLMLSFGPVTLPHELALVVCAEQVYRAYTILAGHPYHCGH